MLKVTKKNKVLYYLEGYSRIIFPSHKSYDKVLSRLEKKLQKNTLDKCRERVDYYCKTSLRNDAALHKIKDLKHPKTPKSYYFDTYQYACLFDEDMGINFLFGDITSVPELPSIVKSRPINDFNTNSIILKLDKARHFVWVKDTVPFSEKKDILLGRGAIYQRHREHFYELYFGHPLCDLGQTNKACHPEWLKPKLSLLEHLKYKFILSLQGNDVATNLKWIMSSKSLAVMPKPTIETWFMEGMLKGGIHYIEIKPDYSDLEETLNYYIKNPKECMNIANNANEYITQFKNKNAEDYCSILVLKKYFGL
ncbi:glycosyl transferase family 90 [Riemerella columbipharyngis]|uniref:Glycosyl transferase family 90 n=1 Tax=Riemerella columbipharyngis TaxID=1071918 RepID=A0A1G6YSU5_9FLAO|nr:glycosyl transferase family 90 [Riemerella columbipharyngis]SDD93352.1 Glycosyl transferase family 90 [Riemerella columbipharyngis]